MQRIPKSIPAAQLTISPVPYYTANPGVTATINNLSLTNTSGAPVAVSLFRVPSGGTAVAGNTILSGFSIAAGQTYVPPQAIGLQLDPGMTLQALAATATSVTIAGGVYETSGSPS
jgi:hypothetical protein